MGTAAGVGAVGVAILKKTRARALLGGEPLSSPGKPYGKSLIPGSILFGMGWGLAGACPGAGLAMPGEGKPGMLFTLGGRFLGAYLYGVQVSCKPEADSGAAMTETSL